LTRRTGALSRGINLWDDETLIRHVYDLHTIKNHLTINKSFVDLIGTVIDADREQFKNQDPEFNDRPLEQINLALKELRSNSMYEDRYNQFLGPLVYSPQPPSWAVALESVFDISRLVWGEEFI